jgi:hypothetical protein
LLALPLTPPPDHSLRGDRSRREAGVGGCNFQTIGREGNHQIWQPFFRWIVDCGLKFTGPRRLSRRELTGYLLTFSLAVPTIVTMAASPSAVAAPASDVAANGPERTVKFHDGVVGPALGQGSARLGQGRHPEAVEEEVTRRHFARHDLD